MSFYQEQHTFQKNTDEKNPTTRKLLVRRVDGYMKRAEKLKKLLRDQEKADEEAAKPNGGEASAEDPDVDPGADAGPDSNDPEPNEKDSSADSSAAGHEQAVVGSRAGRSLLPSRPPCSSFLCFVELPDE